MFSKAKKIYAAFSRTERAAFIGAVFVALISAASGGYLLFVSLTTSAAARGGSFTEGIVGQPMFVNPVTAQTEPDKALVHLVFGNLKDLASKIENAQEGRVWRVRLKDDLLWHDGVKLTSDDVLFTIQSIQNPDARSPLYASWQGIIAQRLSEREVQFNLGAPYAFFETVYLENLFILPKHLFADTPPTNWRLSEFNLKPVGSGPYMFDAYAKEPNGFISEYKLVANPKHHGGEPFITSLSVKFFTKKEDAIQAFNGGKISGLAGLDPDESGKILRPHQLLTMLLPNYYAVFINQNQHIALKETAVRKALGYAADRKKLVENAVRTFGSPAYGPVPAWSEEFDDTAIRNAFSPEEAAGVLDGAGWMRGEDGIRSKIIKNATITLKFSLAVPNAPYLVETAHALQAAWERIGVKTELTVLPVSEIREKSIKNRDYQLLLFGNILNAKTDLAPFWHSAERFYPGLNLSLYANKDADQLMDRIKQTADPEKLKDDFAHLQRIISDDAPAVFLFSPQYLYAIDNDIKTDKPGLIAEPSDRFSDIALWHIKTRRMLK